VRATICAVVMLAFGCQPECIRSHVETCHQPAWVQWLPMGKSMIPIWHREYDYECEVCDERAAD
jgi:hypothetical protein